MKNYSTHEFVKSMSVTTAVAISGLATAFSLALIANLANAQTAPIALSTAAASKPSHVNIGDKPAVLFDAPSTRANKLFILLRATPVEALVRLDKWVKVRDHEGTIGWVESEALAARTSPKQIAVNAISAQIRAAADDSSAVIFGAQRNVLLEITATAAPAGWLAVKHRDGQAGFIKVGEVWGE